jgi:hypothetical protein
MTVPSVGVEFLDRAIHVAEGLTVGLFSPLS